MFPANIGVQLIIQYSLQSGQLGLEVDTYSCHLSRLLVLDQRSILTREKAMWSTALGSILVIETIWLKLLGLMLFTAFMIQFFVLIMPSENNAVGSVPFIPRIAIGHCPSALLAYANGWFCRRGDLSRFMQNTMSKYPKWLNFLLVGIFFQCASTTLTAFYPVCFCLYGIQHSGLSAAVLGLVIFVYW